ncbi:MAG TPA: DUF222 domain-containing protein [Acidimicrobiales bacterium]|nr:DUF222 domain-containing protein [Acidimicrobiales bacterium]
MFVSLASAVDEVCDVDVAALADGEVGDAIVELARLRARLEAVEASLAASFDARRAYAPSGAKTARAWIAAETREPASEVGARVWLGRKLRDLPALVGEAWRAGRIGEAHARRLAGAVNDRTAALFARDVELLVEQAERLRWFEFHQAIEYWFRLADGEGAGERRGAPQPAQGAPVRIDRRPVVRVDDLGSAVGHDRGQRAGPPRAPAVRRRPGQGPRRAGSRPAGPRLARTPEQRRADALVEMARRSRSLPEGIAAARPLFTVLVGEDTFRRTCELSGGQILSPELLAPWLCDCVFERIVFGAPDRVLSVSRQRSFPDAVRRAIEVRDRRCHHHTCDTPADRCQIDHIRPWSDGGSTCVDNGRPACGHHNRWQWTDGDQNRPHDPYDDPHERPPPDNG